MEVWIFEEPIYETLSEATSQVDNQSIMKCISDGRQAAATSGTSILYGFVFFTGRAVLLRTHVCS